MFVRHCDFNDAAMAVARSPLGPHRIDLNGIEQILSDRECSATQLIKRSPIKR